jgi:oligopeptide transport system ATP-binding protein
LGLCFKVAVSAGSPANLEIVVSCQSPENQLLLEIKGVIKHFPIRKGFFNRQVGKVRALDGIDLTAFAGETLGLVGESGCGKSTLGRIILRLLPASEGTVTFDGQVFRSGSEAAGSSPASIMKTAGLLVEDRERDRKALKFLRRNMQIVFQNPYASLDPRMTIGESIGEPLQVHGTASGIELQKQVKELMKLVGLADTMFDRYPHEFSGGQRQRVGIARALSLKPRLVVLDEPVSALDVSVQAQILNLLIDLRSQFKLTYVFIAHNLDVVRYISDRIAVMYLGKIAELGSCADVYGRPLHPYSRALVSAAPVPDPCADLSGRIILQGDLPSPASPPSGCRFSTRCPIVAERCGSEEPLLREIEAGHFSACHFAEKLLS